MVSRFVKIRYVLQLSSDSFQINKFLNLSPFLSLTFFELLSSSLLLFPQRFGRYVLRPSSGICRGFNKGRSSKYRKSSRVRQTPGEGRRTYRSKRCGINNKDEDNSSKNLKDKNQKALSQKFRQPFILVFS